MQIFGEGGLTLAMAASRRLRKLWWLAVVLPAFVIGAIFALLAWDAGFERGGQILLYVAFWPLAASALAAVTVIRAAFIGWVGKNLKQDYHSGQLFE